MKNKIGIFNAIACVLLWCVLLVGFTDIIDTSLPQGSDDPAEADDNMRRIQGGFQELMNVDHIFDKTGTEISNADSGEHRKILFHAPIASTPTVAENHGDLRIKDVSSKAELHWTDEDENELQLTSKGNNLANETYLTSTDNAGTGSVDLIKADANDLSTLPDGALLAAATASGDGDRTIADKGYVDARGIHQVVNTQTGAVNTGTTRMPYDNSIPQITEGDEYMTLAITPTSATNILLIEAVIQLASSDTGAHEVMSAALFQDATANAIAAAGEHISFVNEPIILTIKHYMVAGTTSETTFRVRAGSHNASKTTTFNGQSTFRRYGGITMSSITITEIKG